MTSYAVEGLTEGFAYSRGAFQELVVGVAPAAGATYTYKIAGQYDTRPIAVYFKLVTDGNAADRVATVQYLDGDGAVFAENGAGVSYPASSTVFYSHLSHRSVGEWGATTPVFAPLEPLFLEPGWSIKINVASIQATDALSGIRLLLERFDTSDAGYEEGERIIRRRARR